MPRFIKPQLATLKSRVPKGEQWLHEIKYDGYRVQVHLNCGRKKVFTRNGLDWTKRFTEIAGALAIPGEALIDGEVVVVHEGRTNFSELQAELAGGRQGRLVYYAFDLLWRNGNLCKLPQIQRKQLLSDMLGENDIELPVLFSEHLVERGARVCYCWRSDLKARCTAFQPRIREQVNHSVVGRLRRTIANNCSDIEGLGSDLPC